MKAVIYTNRREDRILEFTRDFPEIAWTVVWSPEELEAAVGDATLVIFSNRICTPEVGAALRRGATDRLKWVHSHSAGIERASTMGIPEGVPLTYSAGAKAPVCAEHAMMLLLALSRRIWELNAAKARHYWARREMNFTIRSLESETLVIVGMGGIGRQIARKAKAFDMRVVGVSRAGRAGGDFDAALPRERLTEALAEADAVIIATDSDPTSRKMMNAAAFAAMKPTAYVINIARGEIVDQDALVTALQDGEIAGAATDVADPEPLDAASPLWDMENVIISPHVSAAGNNVSYRRLKELFAGELARFRAGEPFAHAFDPDAAAKRAARADQQA
ncbi:MAG: D-2-hydroxyacid dehydrogenase [Alphaproteobacteria bacterium]|nr:D-2-hydroxyacid dehydrogenase [Alphaproteobacteria bacterium]